MGAVFPCRHGVPVASLLRLGLALLVVSATGGCCRNPGRAGPPRAEVLGWVRTQLSPAGMAPDEDGLRFEAAPDPQTPNGWQVNTSHELVAREPLYRILDDTERTEEWRRQGLLPASRRYDPYRQSALVTSLILVPKTAPGVRTRCHGRLQVSRQVDRWTCSNAFSDPELWDLPFLLGAPRARFSVQAPGVIVVRGSPEAEAFFVEQRQIKAETER